jgi:antitoxin VapB
MAYSIKDPQTDAIIRRLAKAKGKPIVDAIREACINELERERSKVPLWERLQPIIQRVATHPLRDVQTHGTDKEFFDDMWDDAK